MRNVILFEPETLCSVHVYVRAEKAELNSSGQTSWLGGGDPNISGKWSLILISSQ